MMFKTCHSKIQKKQAKNKTKQTPYLSPFSVECSESSTFRKFYVLKFSYFWWLVKGNILERIQLTIQERNREESQTKEEEENMTIKAEGHHFESEK